MPRQYKVVLVPGKFLDALEIIAGQTLVHSGKPFFQARPEIDCAKDAA